MICVNLPLPPPKEGNAGGDVETHAVRLCKDCLRRRCASQCRDGACNVSTVFAGQEIATHAQVPQGLY
ncbi:MAG: hypothetical protein LBD59_02715 [Prevotellaceae bacterium]|nr:hypothetical protein [Prevotellaceae bacterium]